MGRVIPVEKNPGAGPARRPERSRKPRRAPEKPEENREKDQPVSRPPGFRGAVKSPLEQAVQEKGQGDFPKAAQESARSCRAAGSIRPAAPRRLCCRPGFFPAPQPDRRKAQHPEAEKTEACRTRPVRNRKSGAVAGRADEPLGREHVCRRAQIVSRRVAAPAGLCASGPAHAMDRGGRAGLGPSFPEDAACAGLPDRRPGLQVARGAADSRMGMPGDRLVVRGVTGAAVRKELARMGICRGGPVAPRAGEFFVGEAGPGLSVQRNAAAGTGALAYPTLVRGTAVTAQTQGSDPLRRARVLRLRDGVTGKAGGFTTLCRSAARRVAPGLARRPLVCVRIVAIQACQETLAGLEGHCAVSSLFGL